MPFTVEPLQRSFAITGGLHHVTRSKPGASEVDRHQPRPRAVVHTLAASMSSPRGAEAAARLGLVYRVVNSFDNPPELVSQ